MSDRQKAAADPEVSAWVTASAGTGKTHVLTSRVLRLLLAGTPPERILCLTFTKAAAAEMANRLQQTLARWVTLSDGELEAALTALGAGQTQAALPLARRLFARVLDVPGGLKIQTIHSFCQSLLARFPLEARLPPYFRLIDERSAAEALQAAVEDVLLKAGWDQADSSLAPALDRMARRLTEYSFNDLVRAVVNERGLLERLGRQFQTLPGIMAATRRNLGLKPQETAEDVIAALRQAPGFDRAGLAEAAGCLMRGGKKDQERSAVIRAWLALDEAGPQEFRAYCRGYLKQDGGVYASLAAKKVCEDYPQVLEILQREAERVMAAHERLALIEVADNTAALLTFGFAALQTYAREKRRQVALDYDDLILATLALLEHPGIAPWVLYKLDGGLDHILVDEAQDTNPEQWRVIEALAGEFFAGQGARNIRRTMFAVGDVKQSIYSFQRADPREFLRAKLDFRDRAEGAGETFRDVALDLSFRSVPAVLDVVDAVFADADVKAGLLDDLYDRHQTVRQGAGGVVELWPTEKPEPQAPGADGAWALPVTLVDQSSPDARLALKIARHLRDLLDRGEILHSRGTAIRPSDILILVRRRTAFDQLLLSALKFLDIPVAGADRMVVTDQIAVMDLMALARFALLPEDDLNLAALLKSPLVGLSEDDLYELAHDRGRHSLWQALAARRGHDPFRAAHDLLVRVLNAADLLPPHEFFAEVLTTPDGAGRSGRERIIARLGAEAHDPLDEFLNLALAFEAGHVPSLQGFIQWLEAREVEIKRDMEQAPDEVRIMTVHGAKGLQAPLVILPDCCQTPDMRDRLVELATPDAVPDRLLLWPASADNCVGVVAEARDRMKARAAEEHLRLLYVALTRAADRLIVTGWEPARGRARDCWYDLIEAGFLRLGEVERVETADGPLLRYRTSQSAPVKPPPPAPSPDRAVALPDWARRPPPPEPVPARPLVPSRPQEQEPAVQSPLLRAVARDRLAVRFRRGTLVHRLLERLPALEPGQRLAAAQRFLKAAGDGADTGEDLLQEVLAVLDHGEFAPLFGPGSQAEVPLAGMVGGVTIAGQVDRLAVTADAVYVVDYKTNRPAPADPDKVAVAYLRQMAGYRRLLAEIYPGRCIHAALLWTDGPRLMKLDPEVLDAIPF